MNSIGNAILQHIGVSPVAEGTNKATGKQSVFEHGYIPTSDAATLSMQGKAYFRGPNSVFWEMIITEFSEDHNEKYALHDTHAHAYLMHAMGAQPINVRITGYLASGRDVDHRVQFLKRYFGEYTPRVTDKPNYDLQVVIKHTTFNMLITQLVVNESNELEDFTTVSLEGLAYNYNQDNGDKLLYEYDNQLHESTDNPTFQSPKGASLVKKDGAQDASAYNAKAVSLAAPSQGNGFPNSRVTKLTE